VLVQAESTWNEKPNSHVENEGFAAALKDLAIYVRSSRNREDLAAGKSWVRDFVGIVLGKN